MCMVASQMLHGHSSNNHWEELPFLDYEVNSYMLDEYYFITASKAAP